MNIVPRAGWAARPPKAVATIPTPTPDLVLHHTVSTGTGPLVVKAIQNFHMDVRLWWDIAYSFLVDANGAVYEGRGGGVRGSHTAGHNSTAHAIALIGNHQTTPVSDAALESLIALVNHGADQLWWPRRITMGHRDVAQTTCPGDMAYNLIPTINQKLEGEPMVLYRGSDPDTPNKRWAVEYWQRQLNRLGEEFAAPWGIHDEYMTAAIVEHAGNTTGAGVGPGEADRIMAKIRAVEAADHDHTASAVTTVEVR